MSILILGSNGFIGKNLKFFFKERGVAYEEFTKKKNTKLSEKINKCDFIIHLADKIKSKKKKDFDISKQFTSNIVSNIVKSKKKNILFMHHQ